MREYAAYISPFQHEFTMQNDTAFQMSASNIRFGTGTTAEVGMDLRWRETEVAI